LAGVGELLLVFEWPGELLARGGEF
jgi:hypothetical protein